MSDCYSPQFRPLHLASAPLPAGTDWRNGLLLRSTNWLGDALMTLPAVWQMRQLVPAGRKLVVLTPKNLVPVWEACPFVDQVVGMGGKHISPDEAAAVKSLNLGVALVMPNSFGSAMDVWKTRVPVRLGRSGRWRRLLLTRSMEEWRRGENKGVCHQLCYYLELASMLGGQVTPSAKMPPLAVDAAAARELGMAPSTRWLAVAPGAAYGPAKQWPVERFGDVASWFCAEGGRVVIVGGGKEVPIAGELARRLPAEAVLNLAGKTDLRQLMSVLSASDAVIANDSGAMHLGAALGKKGVALFGSTDPVATGPLGGRWKLQIAQASCRPCLKRTCPLQGDEAYKCLLSLSPRDVIADLRELLAAGA